jgi:hypothetical protein
MVQRISKEDFVDLIGLHTGNGDFETKEEAVNYFINNYNEDEQYSIILPCFQTNGRKGDNLNVQLISMQNTGLDLYNQQHIDLLCGLVDENITRLPLLGSMCTKPCDLVDVRVNVVKKTVDYKFKFEVERVEDVDGKPISKMQYLFIECRHYHDQGIIAVVDTRKTERKIVLELINTIPFYIMLTISKNIDSVMFSIPEFSEIEIFPAQLDMLKQFLRGKLKSAEFMLEGEKNVKVKIDGSTEDFEIESNYLKLTSKRGKSLAVTFYYTDSSSNKSIVQIKSNAQITSTTCVDEYTLERVIKLINRINGYKDYMYPFDDIINQYCNFIKRGMVTRAKIKHNNEILIGIKDLINKILLETGLEFEPTKAYINIVINIIIMLLKTEKYNSYGHVVNIDLEDEFKKFLKVYLKQKYHISISDDNIQIVVTVLHDIIADAKDNEEKIIEECSTKYI